MAGDRRQPGNQRRSLSTLLALLGIVASIVVAGLALQAATAASTFPSFSPRVVSADQAVQFSSTPTPAPGASDDQDDDHDDDGESDDDDD